MDSYLTGVTATSALTMAEMKSDLQRRNVITFDWQERGPLSRAFASGGEIPDPFTISISFADLAQWLWGFDLSDGSPSLGPLASLFDLRADSEVLLTDVQNGTSIDYDVTGVAATLREIDNLGVEYQVNHIEAHNGEYRLEGTASELRYRNGGLRGTFTYRVHGESQDVVVSDSYDPASGLATTWRCP